MLAECAYGISEKAGEIKVEEKDFLTEYLV